MLIVQQPPSQPSPQVSGTARPQKELITWQEFKRQRQQDSEVAPSDVATSKSGQIAPEQWQLIDLQAQLDGEEMAVFVLVGTRLLW